MREIDDERERLLLRDPRRDPTDPPPPIKGEIDDQPVSEQDPPPSEPQPPAPESNEPPSSRRSTDSGSIITVSDPRITELEPLVAAADWEGVLKKLGSEQDAGRLPPNLGLLYALAYKEHHLETESQTKSPKSKDKDAYDANAVAIRCMAGLFGVPHESPIALVLGKRLIRSNPVGWQKKKAPSAPISVLIVALGLMIGAGIGWLLSFGYVTFRLPSIPFLP